MTAPAAEHFDLIVLGGGPAGSSGAAAGGMLGKRVALVERSPLLGGAGINTGTLPSKTLRETSLMLSGWRARRLLGVDLSLRREATVTDFMEHKIRVTDRERQRVVANLALRQVVTYKGDGSFLDPHTIRVIGKSGEETLLRGERILIATGSSPLRPPEFAFEEERVYDSDEILTLKSMPGKLVVIGGGVIGSEYAGTFAALGSEVHLVDGRDCLMPFLDAEVSKGLEKAMAANGVRFHWHERVLSCDSSDPNRVVLNLSSGATLEGDGVLVCAGRCSNTPQLNLAAAGVTPGNRGLVPVGAHYQSVDVPHIYAAGDVIGPPALAATGIEQARVAVCHAFGETFKAEVSSLLPTGIYTIPEASCVGDTEEALQQKQIPYFAGRARYEDIPRGQIIGDTTGFLKLLFHQEDMRLLGVHVMGEHATEIVHLGLIAMMMNATADLFNLACFNYPTLGDLYKYAAYDALLQRRESVGGVRSKT
jgi:NAD(P) transhydrogenase